MRVALTLGMASLLCPAPGAQASDEVTQTSIKGGKETKMCEWAPTVWLGGCTATVIHPRVVLYAAHCGSRYKSVFFGEERGSLGSLSAKVKYCKTNPEYRGSSDLGDGVDYAFCLLEKPLHNMPLAPIGYGCELEHVNSDNPVWLVGFGLNDNKEGRPKQGVKRMVKTNIGRKSADGKEIELGRLGFVSSSGDSGGPAFVKLKDGTWRTVGITSWGAGPGPNWYVSAAIAVPWIHKMLKEDGQDDIDITPCFDDDGTWAPSKECGGFAVDLGTAYGAYKDECAVGAPLSGPAATCGEPNPDAKQGNSKSLSVEISSPKSGKMVPEGQELEVKAKLKGVPKGKEAKVTLLVSGKSRETLKKAPYAWTLGDLDAGTYELVVSAEVEDSTLKMESKPISIEVTKKEEKKSNAPEPSESENASDKGSQGDASKKQGDDKKDAVGSDQESPADSPQASDGEDNGDRVGCSTGEPAGWGPGLMLLLFGVVASRGRG